MTDNTEHRPLPTTFEETIDFVYEVKNMADATARAVTLLPLISSHANLVAALEQIAEGTVDVQYPFRCLPRDEMRKIARAALASLKEQSNA